MARHLPGLAHMGPSDAGMHATLHLAPGLLDSDVVGRLHRRGIGAEAVSTRCWQVQGLNGLIVSYGASPPPAIDTAVRTLGQVLREPPAPREIRT